MWFVLIQENCHKRFLISRQMALSELFFTTNWAITLRWLLSFTSDFQFIKKSIVWVSQQMAVRELSLTAIKSTKISLPLPSWNPLQSIDNVPLIPRWWWGVFLFLGTPYNWFWSVNRWRFWIVSNYHLSIHISLIATSFTSDFHFIEEEYRVTLHRWRSRSYLSPQLNQPKSLYLCRLETHSNPSTMSVSSHVGGVASWFRRRASLLISAPINNIAFLPHGDGVVLRFHPFSASATAAVTAVLIWLMDLKIGDYRRVRIVRSRFKTAISEHWQCRAKKNVKEERECPDWKMRMS